MWAPDAGPGRSAPPSAESGRKPVRTRARPGSTQALRHEITLEKQTIRALWTVREGRLPRHFCHCSSRDHREEASRLASRPPAARDDGRSCAGSTPRSLASCAVPTVPLQHLVDVALLPRRAPARAAGWAPAARAAAPGSSEWISGRFGQHHRLLDAFSSWRMLPGQRKRLMATSACGENPSPCSPAPARTGSGTTLPASRRPRRGRDSAGRCRWITFDAVVQVPAEPARLHLLVHVLVGGCDHRMSTGSALFSPTRVTAWSCSARKQLHLQDRRASLRSRPGTAFRRSPPGTARGARQRPR